MATGSTSDISVATGPATNFVATSAGQPVPVPRLEQGDHLTCAEFERRYDAMPELKKAELIEGVVYMPSPVRMDVHGAPHADLLAWLATYRAATPSVMAGDNATLRLDNDNMPQPDALLIIDSRCGGRAMIDETGYVAGAPELVAEIASSTVSIDLHDKLNVFRRNGVREYIAWRVLDRAIDWFALRDGEFKPLAVDADGIIRSLSGSVVKCSCDATR
jgi:Uma2 family endonuclease